MQNFKLLEIRLISVVKLSCTWKGLINFWRMWHNLHRNVRNTSTCGSHLAIFTFGGLLGIVSASHFQRILCSSSANACKKASLFSAASVSVLTNYSRLKYMTPCSESSKNFRMSWNRKYYRWHHEQSRSNSYLGKTNDNWREPGTTICWKNIYV